LIQYTDCAGKQRWYLSDYIIGNTVYKIKSDRTWNCQGQNLVAEQNNINKLTATIQAGNTVKLIQEGKTIDFTK
jgi:hypothetical protein